LNTGSQKTPETHSKTESWEGLNSALLTRFFYVDYISVERGREGWGRGKERGERG
jgi:hypothetical protein